MGMSERKYVVPEGMLKAAHGAAVQNGGQIEECLEAALRWLDAKLDQCVVAGDGARTIEHDCAACSLRRSLGCRGGGRFPTCSWIPTRICSLQRNNCEDFRSLPSRSESRPEMSDPVHTVPPPLPVADPKCPKCNITLQFAHKLVTTASRSVISMLWCSACGHLLNVQWVGETPKEQAGPRLIVPN